MTEVGRNRFTLDLTIELTHPVTGDAAKAAAELLAHDIRNYLTNEDWGYGRARVESVYAPASQFTHGDFAEIDA